MPIPSDINVGVCRVKLTPKLTLSYYHAVVEARSFGCSDGAPRENPCALFETGVDGWDWREAPHQVCQGKVIGDEDPLSLTLLASLHQLLSGRFA